MSELLQAVDRGELGALILLDLTAVFNTVDHDILLLRLQQTFDVDDNAHRWFRSYLVGRTQHVRRSASVTHHRLLCGVPQSPFWGRCCSFVHLRPESPDPTNHLYADDTQVSG